MKNFILVIALIVIAQGCSHGNRGSKDVEISKPTPKGPVITIPHDINKPTLPPKVGTPSFSLQYDGPLSTRKVDYFYVDNNKYSKEEIAKLKAQGTKVFCYYSSQYEKWRKDAGEFPKEDIGKSIPGWSGESFVNPKSEKVKAIMMNRMKLAKEKGCDGQDPDNTDFYGFTTGFDNSMKAAKEYALWICNEGHKLGLLYSHKNSLKMIDEMGDCPDAFQNEECQNFDECDYYSKVKVTKPVFNIEYGRCKKVPGIYSIRKDMEAMDEWEELCK